MKSSVHYYALPMMMFFYSIGALAIAYVSENVYDMKPCILCIYQRIPYFIVIVLVFLMWLSSGGLKLFFIALGGVAFLVGAGIAGYHVGVEQGIFKMTEGCVDALGAAVSTLEELRNQLIGMPSVPCDKPQFVFLSVSMAGWNFIFSNMMSLYTFIACISMLRMHKVK